MLRHPLYNFLAASADGYFLMPETSEVCCLELKTPFQRKLEGKPSLQYYHQMQAQMAVLNLSICYFSDAYINKISSRDFDEARVCIDQGCREKADARGAHCLGVFVRDKKNDKYHYASPITTKHSDFVKWLEQQTTFLGKDNCQPIYYHVSNHFVTKVKRDDEWMAKLVPLLWATMINIIHLRDVI